MTRKLEVIEFPMIRFWWKFVQAEFLVELSPAASTVLNSKQLYAWIAPRHHDVEQAIILFTKAYKAPFYKPPVHRGRVNGQWLSKASNFHIATSTSCLLPIFLLDYIPTNEAL